MQSVTHLLETDSNERKDSQMKNPTKAQLLQRIANLEHDLDLLNEEHISPESCQEMCDEAYRNGINAHFQAIQRRDPETHRANFKLIEGGIAC